uniref:Uncharacterized protein n=1 Tax=Macrostomum lignano TaxID=282301 RepID=A0A1I8FMG8_9PLAT
MQSRVEIFGQTCHYKCFETIDQLANTVAPRRPERGRDLSTFYTSCVKLKILDSGTPPSCDGHQAARKRPAAEPAAALTALTPLKRQVLEASSIEKPLSKRRKNRQQKTLAPF